MWINCGKLWIDVNYKKFKIYKDLGMAETGYSGTPLINKLGIKPDMKILVIHPPKNYFQWLGVNISDQYVSPNQIPDLIHLFTESEAVFKKEMKNILSLCKKILPWLFGYPGIKKVRGFYLTYLRI